MAMSRGLKASLAAMSTAALGASGWWVLAASDPSAGVAPSAVKATAPPRRVARVVMPEPLDKAGSITLNGRTVPVEQAVLTSRATGFVAERRVDIGDKVKAGDVLLTIDAPDVAQELLRARAAVEQSQARLNLAKLNFDRAEALVTKGHISEQVRDERQATAKSAEADVAAALADVRRLQEIVSFQQIRAPFDGTIVTRNVERGDRVTTSDTQSASGLLRIARLDQLRVEVDVPQSSALKVQTGSEASISFAEIPGQVFKARVVRSAGLIDAQSSTMRIELLMDNPDQRIPAGLNGLVSLQFVPLVNVVTVPTNTLVIREGQQRVAIANDDDTVAFRAVRVGRDFGDRVEIVSGLAPENRVILSPNAMLRDGDKVEVTMVRAATKTGSETK